MHSFNSPYAQKGHYCRDGHKRRYRVRKWEKKCSRAQRYSRAGVNPITRSKIKERGKQKGRKKERKTERKTETNKQRNKERQKEKKRKKDRKKDRKKERQEGSKDK